MVRSFLARTKSACFVCRPGIYFVRSSDGAYRKQGPTGVLQIALGDSASAFAVRRDNDLSHFRQRKNEQKPDEKISLDIQRASRRVLSAG